MKVDNDILLSKISQAENSTLLDYMAEQGISAAVCQKYLQLIKLYNRQDKKYFYALGMLNEEGGFELVNQSYSGWINSEYKDGQRDVSVIRGSEYPTRKLHIFLNMKDFLALAARKKDHWFSGDVLILHTYDLLHKVPPYLYQNTYKQLISWMPNDDYGKTAIDAMTAYCLVERSVEHVPMNHSFARHETIREWCVAQSALVKG
ncbi:hypothetical protein A4D02_30790 [Niastella koreensis]|nr:hypothetical protein [Niastella koreensis]OQP46430.1 hypothetical protein A4D02_30790 [Niastella koreensis]